MNKCDFVGRFTKDPELKYIPNGETAVLNFTLAVDRKFKKEGQPTADFLNFVAFGKPAEILSKYCEKGNQLAVTSRVQTRNWENTEGKKQYVTEFVVEEFTFISGNKSNTNENKNNKPTSSAQEFNLDDDIPF